MAAGSKRLVTGNFTTLTRNDITKPSYWSCKMWEKKKSVTDYLN